MEELLRYFVHHGRAVYCFLPLLAVPFVFAAAWLNTSVPWPRLLLYALCQAFMVPSMAFNIHILARFIFICFFPRHLKSLWPNLGFQAGLFILGTGLGLAFFYMALLWVDDAILLSIFKNKMVALPIPIFVLVSFFYFSSRYFEEEFQKAKQTAIESEYHALKSQMQPHFLFNSLHTLSDLIETDPGQALGMVHDLADLYRYILDKGKHNTVSLEDEIGIVVKYLKLQKQRLGDRLQYRFILPNKIPGLPLPALLLQTLVENAIRHGIAPCPEGGVVKVEVSREGQRGYHILVSNTGRPLGEKPCHGTGISNCVARLDHLYGDQHAFRVSREAHQTIARFFVPNKGCLNG